MKVALEVFSWHPSLERRANGGLHPEESRRYQRDHPDQSGTTARPSRSQRNVNSYERSDHGSVSNAADDNTETEPNAFTSDEFHDVAMGLVGL